MKGKIVNSATLAGDFQSTDTEDLNIINPLDLTDSCTTFHPATTEYAFSNAHETFCRIHHMLGPKVSFNKFKSTDIM